MLQNDEEAHRYIPLATAVNESRSCILIVINAHRTGDEGLMTLESGTVRSGCSLAVIYPSLTSYSENGSRDTVYVRVSSM